MNFSLIDIAATVFAILAALWMITLLGCVVSLNPSGFIDALNSYCDFFPEPGEKATRTGTDLAL